MNDFVMHTGRDNLRSRLDTLGTISAQRRSTRAS